MSTKSTAATTTRTALGVWISGQVRRVTAPIRREMKRRAAVEPVIGHVKAEHRMDRNYLKGRVGDRVNAVLAAAGFNFGLLLRWLAELLRTILRAFAETPRRHKGSLKSAVGRVLHGGLMTVCLFNSSAAGLTPSLPQSRNPMFSIDSEDAAPN